MILDGKIVSKNRMEYLKKGFDEISDKYRIVPELRLVQVGNDEASTVYARAKIKRGNSLGINVVLDHFDSLSEEELIKYIRQLNSKSSINGIMIESPLPGKLNFNRVLENISFYRDVDGMTSTNQGQLGLRNELIAPATARAVIDILEYYKIEGKNACIINRSPVVGRPLSMLLLNRDYTVTICHSRTDDIRKLSNNNDIIVVAVGKPNFLDESYVNASSTVIDVGINYIDGKITGDADFNSINSKVKNITPVPGGVGIVTSTDIFLNLLNGMQYQLNNH
ncbi:MAG: bifunctional 5,10-methylenetetrahydrofolate dehydrogenase/5,10-methenyltetrahydrofolate cyclohydrolase [Ferroplasma sp.]